MSSREKGVKRWRTLAMILILASSIASIIGYIALSETANAPPPNLRSGNLLDGAPRAWITVLKPLGESQADEVDIDVYAQGDSSIRLYVSACGPNRYVGSVLMFGFSSIYSPDLKPVPDYAHSVIKEHAVSSYYGPVQVFDISLSADTACSGPIREAAIFFGSTSSPWLQNSSGFLGIRHGPHASIDLPGVDYDEYEITQNNSSIGDDEIPQRQKIQVAAELPGSWSMESATPTPDVAEQAGWSSDGPIVPTAQFIDQPSMAAIQNWIVILAVCFGIGGGLLGSMILEWIRPESASQVSRNSDRAVPMPPPGTARGGRKSSVFLAWLFIFISVILRRRFSRL